MRNQNRFPRSRGPLMLIAAALLALALTLAACGDDEDDGGTEAAEGETALTGDFEMVEGAPEDTDPLSGTAELVVSDEGTTAEIQLQGLGPDTEYIAHVHEGGCDQPDPGGPHFKFDLNGSDMPPNEIHLPFSSDAEGGGSATATNEQAVPEPDGRSIVVHLAGEDDHGGGHGDGMDSEKEHGDGMDSEKEHGDGMDSEKEHGDDGEHSGASGKSGGHTHSPKLACAQL